MKSIDQALLELEKLIDVKIKDYSIPETKGDTIRINHILIRPSKNQGYVVIDTKNNKSITTTFSKVGAVAVAKAYLKSLPIIKFTNLDSTIEKHVNDSWFYSNIINKTDDAIRRNTLESRLEFAKCKINYAKDSLDQFILNDIR
jgi:hypothetical protein